MYWLFVFVLSPVLEDVSMILVSRVLVSMLQYVLLLVVWPDFFGFDLVE